MLQLVYRFSHHIRAGSSFYLVRVYGELREDGRYAGRLLFFPLRGGRVLSTGVETTQSDAPALVHWASALSGTYLEGALARAIARQPEVQLEQQLAQLERAEAEAASEAVELEDAADAARREVRSIQQARREVKQQLI
jgi:hypothetical protein